MKKKTKITATQNTTDTAAQTSCPTMGETFASDILTIKFGREATKLVIINNEKYTTSSNLYTSFSSLVKDESQCFRPENPRIRLKTRLNPTSSPELVELYN
ncbi:hypothetical protein OS493_020243 [Desmophyllum pertusum]|uniref:Uncharacterized protein n=1 Tax=Desmophyllum pertusum TaxID=174260 RepID=A0A9W9ZMY4_9CNID|nr:hypothetical protein OS493_020243 [Desmophyllum pertusum]